jgi:hypothetical protein
MWKNFKVIDADGHMHEPQYLSERSVDVRYREQVTAMSLPRLTFSSRRHRVNERIK